MLSRKLPSYAGVILFAALFSGCTSNEPGRELIIPPLDHISPAQSEALSVNFAGTESSLVRLPLEGPSGIEISGLPSTAETRLIISSAYDYSIVCNGQLAPSRAKPPCRKYNPYTYSEDCDFPPGLSAKTTSLFPKENKIYCEITPFFWRAYCNPDEEGEEEARSHSHTYDGGGCDQQSSQEFLVYLYTSQAG